MGGAVIGSRLPNPKPYVEFASKCNDPVFAAAQKSDASRLSCCSLVVKKRF